MYAQAGIREFWLVYLLDECVELHRQPQADGTYADVQTRRRAEQIEIQALAGIRIGVDEIL